jgi:hypothetical protein
MNAYLAIVAAVGAALIGCGSSGHEAATSTGGSSSSAGGGGAGGASSGGGGSGGAPSGPKCTAKQTTLVKGLNIDDVAVNATDVFFTVNNGDPKTPGSVSSVPIRGGKATVLTPAAMPIGVALTDTDVIFGDEAGGIFSVPLAGGTKKKIAPTQGQPTHLVTDATHVYFSDNVGTKSVPIAGGAVKTLSSDVGFSLAIDGDNLIIADFGGGRVLSVPRTGGATKTLATMQGGPLYPLVVGQDLVWIDSGDLMTGVGTLMRLSPGGMPTEISMGGALFRPHGVAYDGTNFYVTADAGPDLAKVPKAGGDPVVVTNLSGDAGVAVDDECIYVAEPILGLISLAK